MMDWRAAADDCLEGVATDQQRREFEAWLAERPENADDCVLWLELHDELQACFRESGIRKRAGISAMVPVRGLSARLAQRPVATLAAFSGAVAALLLSALWMGGVLRSPTDREANTQLASASRAAAEASAATEPIAATLTGAVDCRWEDDARTIAYGEHLHAGDVLRLAEGLAQVTYESGAKVVLRGPGEFRIEGPAAGVLPIGQITAVVPRRATGFVVKTPSAEIIDLGTEFGIDVDPSGASEVHVFKGEVVSRSLAVYDESAAPLHLLTNEAAAYRPGEATAREFAADSKRFIREITPRLTDLPRAPQVRNLALWLAADLLVKTTPDERVVAWRDVLCGDNQAPDDALQPNDWSRPTLIQGGLNGGDAIRFDGLASHLVTTPMETAVSQTVFVVARIAESQSNSHPGSLLNYNGPPHRNIDRETADRGVFQLGLGRPNGGPNERLYGPDDIGAQAFVYVGSGARSGDVTGRPLKRNEAFVLAYVYNVWSNKASLYVNGELEAQASAPAPANATSRRVLGRHGFRPQFFRGDVGEVLIYNRPLKVPELANITDYLFGKYSINR